MNYLKESLGQTSYRWSEPSVFELLKDVLEPTRWNTTKSGNVDFRSGRE